MLWTLACVTTAILNLDTTVVLLTPLSVRLARRSGTDPFTLALIPLFTAAFASSFLPVSNLTTLIVTERLDLTVADVVTHLAIPGFAACVVGWFVFRRGAPGALAAGTHDVVDRRVLTIGSCVVAGLLVGFVFGGHWGIDPWVVASVADVLLAFVTRTLPWRSIPVFTAVGVAPRSGSPRRSSSRPPRRSASRPSTHRWHSPERSASPRAQRTSWRIVRREGVEVDARSYIRATVPVAVPALVAAALCLAAGRAISG